MGQLLLLLSCRLLPLNWTRFIQINLSSQLTGLVTPLAAASRPSVRNLPSLLRSSPALSSSLNPLYLLAKGVIAISNWRIPLLDGTAPKDLSATSKLFQIHLYLFAEAIPLLSPTDRHKIISSRVVALSVCFNTRHSIGFGSRDGSNRFGRGSSPLYSVRFSLHSSQPFLSCCPPDECRFYNTMWLIANDVIIGSAFTSFVCENSDFVGKRLGQIVQVSQSSQQSFRSRSDVFASNRILL